MCDFCRHTLAWLTQLLMISLLLWISLFLSLNWVQPVSRRACNMSYVLWALALNWTMLVTFLIGGMLSGSVEAPVLLSAFSHNMLPLFLLANLMTGAVNICIDSLSMSNSYARAVVSIYMSLMCLLAYALYSRGIHCQSKGINTGDKTMKDGKIAG